MKPLLIIGHPGYYNSIANKTIVSQIQRDIDINITNLIKLYPDYKIDVEKEQQKLLKTNLIIFQFPIFWASMPAILKLWIDEVFTDGFAYGTAYKLERKKLLVSATLSGEDTEESKINVNDRILFPFKGIAEFCKMTYLKPIVLYGMNYGQKKDKDFFVHKAIKHSKGIIKIISYERKD